MDDGEGVIAVRGDAPSGFTTLHDGDHSPTATSAPSAM
jgi:hypothetical protein